MRRVRLIKKGENRENTWKRAGFGDSPLSAAEMEEIVFFKHFCDDECFAGLIDSLGFSGKKITPSRVRKLVLEAIRMHMENR